MYISLRTKISLTIISVVLLFTFFTLLYFPSQRRKMLLSNFNKEVQGLSNTVALGVRIALNEQNYEGVQTAMEFVKGNPDLRFVILLESDTVWNDAQTAYQVKENVFKTFPEGVTLPPTLSSGDSIIIKRTPFETSLMSGAIVLGFSTNAINKSENQIFRTSLLISSVISVIGLISGLLISRHFTSPIIALRNASQRVAKGDLSPAIKHFPNDEIGDLAKAFNIMVQELSRSREELQEANRALSQSNDNLSTTLKELKATQVQLIQSEKMASLGELTAGIAHEIQNPLNFVNNFSEANKELLVELKQELKNGHFKDVEKIVEDLEKNEEKITYHGKRADSIVKNMLQHSHSSTGEKQPSDINALVDEYLRLSYHGFRVKDKTFHTAIKIDFDDKIMQVPVVPQDIGRVLLNLFNNAFYAVCEKKKRLKEAFQPVVTVATEEKDNHVLITVSDNGTGMSHKVAEKVFQPFFTTKPTGEGTGLGLSLSYDIITKGHGGDLKVHTKEGEYTEFIIQLPL